MDHCANQEESMDTFKKLLRLSDQVLGTALLAVRDNLLDVAVSLVCQQANRSLNAAVAPVLKSQGVASPWASDRLAARTVDGAMLESQQGWQKLAIRKGLPPAGTTEKRLGVENEPHTVSGFDGQIADGQYGAGYKKLLLDETVLVKIEGQSSLRRANYHEHVANKAGLHYDWCVEGVPAGTNRYEFQVFKGEFKGRYSVIRTDRGMLIANMKDNGRQFVKPTTPLKSSDFLEEIEPDIDNWNISRKYDGSSASDTIVNNRSAFHGHRDVSRTYYGNLPTLEFLDNKSPYFSCRQLFKGPNQDGTMLIGEVVHSDGAPRVGGILNAYPDKAHEIQHTRGGAEFYVWDIERLRGKDVSNLPQWKRHELYEEAVRDIRRFNRSYRSVENRPEGMTAREYYDHVLQAPLPWGEGIVAKHKYSVDRVWSKAKRSDTVDMKVTAFNRGTGKYANSLGSIEVEAATGERGRVGSFSITDDQRQWLFDNRDLLVGQVAEIEAFALTEKRGVPRAGRFVRFHPSQSEAALLLYAETLSGNDDRTSTLNTKYALIQGARR
jgi:hypothetical protein